MQGQRNSRLTIGLYVGLALLTAAVFWRVRTYDFINYDDQLYLTNNRVVQNGLTWDGVKWAFGRIVGNGTYWHPLTWLSHMLDCEWFKMDAGKHHLTSLGFHIANVLLLFALLHRITQKIWRSVLVALLFALHPLQVDSVAWLAERKNLLSTFFGLLTMLFYAAYARSKMEQSFHSTFNYFAALFCFALTLMSKPFVTLPCVLLLLDVWPFQRMTMEASRFVSSLGRLFWEKVPFFALSLTSGVITILAHKKLALITEAHQLSLGARLANSAVAYWRYVRKVFWPDDLAVYYPLPPAWPTWLVVGAAIFVVGVSALAFWSIKKRSYIFTGWFWFFGTLVPFIGLLQVNDQAMADRFAYVPLIGLFMALIWALADLPSKISLPQNVKFSLGIVAVLAAIGATSVQLGHWKNSKTLFQHAIRVSESNIAHINYAAAVEAEGTMEALLEARQHYERALAIIPENSMAESNLGVTLAKMGQLEEAMPHFLKAVEINPDNADARSNLGLAFTHLKRWDDALKELNEAVRLQPDHASARNNLANVLTQVGRLEEAVSYYEESIRLQPGNIDAHNNLGFTLMKLGRNEAAKKTFENVLQIRTDHAPAHFNLGNIFKAEGRKAEARQHYVAAIQSKPDYAEAHYELGRLLKNEGQDSAAGVHFDQAVKLRPEWKAQVDSLAAQAP